MMWKTQNALIYSQCIPFDLFYNEPKLKMNTIFFESKTSAE